MREVRTMNDDSLGNVGKLPVSVLMLTYNEAKNLPACLARLITYVDDVHIVDSFSTDPTMSIAQGHGAKVYQHVFEGHARQWLWGFANAKFKHDWVFMHD